MNEPTYSHAIDHSSTNNHSVVAVAVYLTSFYSPLPLTTAEALSTAFYMSQVTSNSLSVLSQVGCWNQRLSLSESIVHAKSGALTTTLAIVCIHIPCEYIWYNVVIFFSESLKFISSHEHHQTEISVGFVSGARVKSKWEVVSLKIG